MTLETPDRKANRAYKVCLVKLDPKARRVFRAKLDRRGHRAKLV